MVIFRWFKRKKIKKNDYYYLRRDVFLKESQMELKNISFCETNCYNVCSNSFKEELLKQISENYGICLTDKSIRVYDPSRHQQVLYRKPYVMSIKSIGNTYYIYLTKINGVNSCFLIDKKILKGYSYPRIILAKCRFCDQLFSGTLIEGDLIKANQGWKLLLGDLLVYKGSDLRHKGFQKRFSLLGHIFTKLYQPDPYLSPCSMFLKRYFPYNQQGQQQLLKLLDNIDYKAQGICFTIEEDYKPSFLVFLENRTQNQPAKISKVTKILTRKDNVNFTAKTNAETTASQGDGNITANVAIKIERECLSSTPKPSDPSDPSDDHPDPTSRPKTVMPIKLLDNENQHQDGATQHISFTFKITKTSTPGIYQLYCLKVGKIIKHSIARINGLKCLNFVKNLLKTERDEALVICDYDAEFKKFIPKMVSGKTKPDEYTDIIYCTHEKM